MKRSEAPNARTSTSSPETCPQTSDGPPPGPDTGFFARLRAGFRAERKFDRPVAWLLGRQFIGSLKGLLLYTAYGKKLDPRDWMQAGVISFSPEDAEGRRAADDFWRAEGRGGFWFDYISDTGDGMRATYSLAYLCLSDLYVPTRDPRSLAAGAEVRTEAGGGAETLPRGQFLFVGGDTAYHASDYMTLASRIQQPFKWAHADLVRDGRLREDEPP